MPAVCGVVMRVHRRFGRICTNTLKKLVIGDRNKQFKLDKAPWNGEKIMKRGLVYLIWFIMALVTALTFNSYAVGTDYLYNSWQWFGVIPVPDWTPLTWVSVLIFTFATFANAGYMRETHFVPYLPLWSLPKCDVR